MQSKEHRCRPPKTFSISPGKVTGAEVHPKVSTFNLLSSLRLLSLAAMILDNEELCNCFNASIICADALLLFLHKHYKGILDAVISLNQSIIQVVLAPVPLPFLRVPVVEQIALTV